MSSEKICIIISMGWGVRNVLMSRALDAVSDRCDLHVLSTFDEVPKFRRRFSHLRLGRIDELSLAGWLRLLYHINSVIFYRLSPSATHKYKLKASKKNLKRTIATNVGVLVAGKRSFNMTRRLLRQALRRTRQYEQVKRYLREHQIGTVVSANPLNFTEYPALIAAMDLGLRTIGIITSWDNLTSKRPLIIDFDEYGVWSRQMADELLRFYPIAKDRISEIGPLQFDYYFDDQFIESRDAFCRRFNFDPDRKIVVHSTVTSGLMPDEPRLIEKLLEALRAGRISGSPNLLVRLHPKRQIKEFAALKVDPRWHGIRVGWSVAGSAVRDRSDCWCPLEEEIKLLTSTVHHGDVNLNVFSTMLLDFAVLGKPSVLIAHNGQDQGLHYTDYEHLQPVLDCGGHRVAESFDETIKLLNAYLERPELDREGRQRLVRLECGPWLGRSYQRLQQLLVGDLADSGSTPTPAVEIEKIPRDRPDAIPAQAAKVGS